MKSFARILSPTLAAICILLGPMSAMAQSGDVVRVRGTVASLEGSTLVVHSRDGVDMSIHLADKWAVTGVVKASLSDVKPGVFIGTASMPKAGDSEAALEVVIFPEAMRGFGEGHYPWDLKPNSNMTNANIAKSVDSVDGREITLSYKGGETKVTVAKDTPIVTFAEATRADIKAGASVFVPTQRLTDGTLNASRVVVGKDGAVPPM